MSASNFTVIDGGKPSKKPTKSKATPPRLKALTHLQAAIDTGIRGALRDAVLAAIDIATAKKQRNISELEYEAIQHGRQLLDPTRPGFLARRTRRGIRLMYRHNAVETGKRIETLIGFLGDITLADARETWRELRDQRLRNESPVIAEKATDAVAPLLTISNLADLYIKEYAEKVKRSYADDIRLLRRHVLPDYGSMTADQFTTEVISDLLGELQNTPREAGKLRASLHTMFNIGIGRTRQKLLKPTRKEIKEGTRHVEWPWLPVGFNNPVSAAETIAHAVNVHEPTGKEIKSYAKNLPLVGMRDDYADTLLLQLLTASRIREITGMAWSEVDLDSGEWVLPAARSKNGKQHTVFLSDAAAEILQRRHEMKAPADEFVFPAPLNHKKSIRPDLVQHALAGNREALGIAPAFTSHNVRHAFTTWAAKNEAAVEVVNRCTNHVIATGINKIYNQAKYHTPAEKLWAAWAEYLRG